MMQLDDVTALLTLFYKMTRKMGNVCLHSVPIRQIKTVGLDSSRKNVQIYCSKPQIYFGIRNIMVPFAFFLKSILADQNLLLRDI